jgi:hypothetical protein
MEGRSWDQLECIVCPSQACVGGGEMAYGMDGTAGLQLLLESLVAARQSILQR